MYKKRNIYKKLVTSLFFSNSLLEVHLQGVRQFLKIVFIRKKKIIGTELSSRL